MPELELKLEGEVAIVTMDEGDNRLNLRMCNAWLAMLDKIEKETGALTLVVKSAHEKIWSNGFDQEWIKAREEAGDNRSVTQFLIRDLELRRRMLLYPLITVAAINGHAFGGGAIFSCCFDFRFMRSDRGYFCIPAIDLGYPIVAGTAALLSQTMPMYMFEDALLTGRRFTGKEAAANCVIRAAYPNDVLMERVMDFARGLNKGRTIIGQMKQVLNSHVIELLDEVDMPTICQGHFSV